MSRNQSNMSSRNQSYRKQSRPVCGHCSNLNKHAGFDKYDTQHWSHATPDPTSAVVCVELNKLICRWCNAPGHTISYCVDKKNHEQRLKSEPRGERDLRTRPSVPKKAYVNPFNALNSDSDDEARAAKKAASKAAKKATKVVVEQFPVLTTPSLSLVHPVKASFAEALAKPLKPITTSEFVRMLELTGYKRDTRSWADQCDDEGSDDELDGDGYKMTY